MYLSGATCPVLLQGGRHEVTPLGQVGPQSLLAAEEENFVILKHWRFFISSWLPDTPGLPPLHRFPLEKRSPKYFYLSNSGEESSDT